jgi:DNA-directed RNA polymerase subunit RPC12/RpoP
MGDIEFICPGCGTSLVIDETGAGMNVNCPNCSSLVIVPDGTPAMALASKPTPVPFRGSHGRTLAILAIVVPCICDAVYWSLSHGRGMPRDAGDGSLAASVAPGSEAAEAPLQGSAPMTEQPERDAEPVQSTVTAGDRDRSQVVIVGSKGTGLSAAPVPRQVASSAPSHSFPLRYVETGKGVNP